MKKIPIALSVLISCVLFSSVVPAQDSHKVAVNFTGKVVEAMCQVVDGSKVVDFGYVTKKNIYDNEVKKTFELQMVNCPKGPALISITREEVNFNKGDGLAQGIVIASNRENGNVREGSKYLFDNDNGQVNVRYSVMIVPTPGKVNAVTVGKIDATGIYTLVYN